MPSASCPHSRTTHLRLNQPLIPSLPFSGSKPIDVKTWRQRSSFIVSTVGFHNGHDVLALWFTQGSPWASCFWVTGPASVLICLLVLQVSADWLWLCKLLSIVVTPNYDFYSHPKVKSKVKSPSVVYNFLQSHGLQTTYEFLYDPGIPYFTVLLSALKIRTMLIYLS